MSLRFGFATAILMSLSASAYADAGDWPMYNYDVRGTRHSVGETQLSPFNVGNLHVQWNVPTPAPVTASAAVVGDTLYIGDWAGNFYALNTANGHARWKTTVPSEISASALVQGDRVFFGDQSGTIRALDRYSGTVEWQAQPNGHPLAAIFSSPVPVGNNIVIGVASNEEIAAGDPSYPCCSFRGSIVMLDGRDGHVVWQTYTVSEQEQARGTAGVGVWGTPTYDEESGILYVTTGNNYSAPSNGLEDSVIALQASTGKILWVNQAVSDDVANFGLPIQPLKDSDYGDSPQLYRLANGRKVVSAGNKNGIFYLMDACTGELLNAKQLQTGGSLGGLFADSAEAYGIVFTNGADWPDPFNFDVLPNRGIVTAITGDGKNQLWQLSIPHEVTLSGVSVANGVLYFASCNPGTGDRLTDDSGTVYAVNALTGRTLATVHTDHCANSGPAISHGRIFVGVGNEYLFAGTPTGNILGIGL